jgi:hypothetical protein
MEGLDRGQRSAAFFGVRNGLGLLERFVASADGLGEPVLIKFGRLRPPPMRGDIFRGDGDGLEAGFREDERRGGCAQGLETDLLQGVGEEAALGLAAWIGLVPRHYTTGGKPRLGGIGRRANHYLRRQMIHGARAIVCRLANHDDRRSEWLKGLMARRGFNRTIVALANKTARIAWVVLTRKDEYAAV